MTKQITFHLHEVEGEKITRTVLKRFGCTEPALIEKTATLVRLHQSRFYLNTKEKTLIKFLNKLIEVKISVGDFFNLLSADRAGNRKKTGFYGLPREVEELRSKLINLNYMHPPVVDKQDLADMGYSLKQQQYIYSNLLGIIRAKPLRNTSKYLLHYITKNYRPENE